MEDWLEIPQGRHAPRPVRLCLVLGLAVLLLLELLAQTGGAAGL